MEVCVDSFHVCQRDLLSQNHLVERADKERIQETTVDDRQPYNAPNELEVV